MIAAQSHRRHCSVQEARAAKEQTNNYQLDKKHKFAVNMFDEFEQFEKVPDEYEAPEEKAYKPLDNLQVWYSVICDKFTC